MKRYLIRYSNTALIYLFVFAQGEKVNLDDLDMEQNETAILLDLWKLSLEKSRVKYLAVDSTLRW